MKRYKSAGLIILACIALVLLGITFWYRHQSDAGPDQANSTNFHASMYYYDNKDFFPQSVKSFENVKPLAAPPHLFIVNQHILAAYIMAHQFALSADPRVKTVILITQNNWNAGQAPIITSRYPWKTPLGDIQPATTVADSLIQAHLASEEEGIFAKEHGITGIVPYVAHSFPNAKIVPLVIRDYTSTTTIDALALALSKLDLSTTAIIGTIDMSHYLPKYVADNHDDLTIQSIREFDYDTLPQLDIDTVPTLRAVMKVAESKHLQTFVVTGHTNSADIVGDPDLLSTTSYISGYFTSGLPQEILGTVHLLFLGDMKYDESAIDRLILGVHEVIQRAGNRVIQGKNICVLEYDDAGTTTSETMQSKIAGIKNTCSFVALLVHWAKAYSALPTSMQTSVSHAFVDAGADVIVGDNTHIEPVETYKNKAIFYSVGDVFSRADKVALDVEIGTSTVTYTFVPLSVVNKSLLLGHGMSSILKQRQIILPFTL